jgi:hypothetical protein
MLHSPNQCNKNLSKFFVGETLMESGFDTVGSRFCCVNIF